MVQEGLQWGNRIDNGGLVGEFKLEERTADVEGKRFVVVNPVFLEQRKEIFSAVSPGDEELAQSRGAYQQWLSEGLYHGEEAPSGIDEAGLQRNQVLSLPEKGQVMTVILEGTLQGHSEAEIVATLARIEGALEDFKSKLRSLGIQMTTKRENQTNADYAVDPKE
ncbi:MAG: hypothetical protein Q8O95_03060 [bacterium]|nr:hypothetical protein [bacterium]